ncbi:hypothetical protein U879_14780 [Defluviimonas sp. 20V17]|nr:hypothetical protein U879_14780 [Defluviimonas sp. 20V17]
MTSYLLTALVGLSPLVLAQGAQAAMPGATWDSAKSCYNQGDFSCAYESALTLYLEGKIKPATGEKTSPSMAFLQAAFVEAAARAQPKDLTQLVHPILKKLNGPDARPPFVYGFAVLADADMCKGRGNTGCEAGFQNLYCHVEAKLPKPEWPALDGVKPLSAEGKAYFTKVMATAPVCPKG